MEDLKKKGGDLDDLKVKKGWFIQCGTGAIEENYTWDDKKVRHELTIGTWSRHLRKSSEGHEQDDEGNQSDKDHSEVEGKESGAIRNGNQHLEELGRKKLNVIGSSKHHQALRNLRGRSKRVSRLRSMRRRRALRSNH